MKIKKMKKSKKKSYIYLFTGNGGGKTIAALGLGLRFYGQGGKVAVVQFMKGRKNIGEFKVQKKLGGRFKVYQFGSKKFVNLKRPSKTDKKLAGKGLEFSKKILKRKPDLLILDEINLACAARLLKTRDVVLFLKDIPADTDVVLTGRRAPRELIKLADGVSIIKKVKHPFDKGIRARRGIEF